MKSNDVKIKKRKIFKKQDIPLYIMALPGFIMLIMFKYLPMSGIVLAFKKYNVGKGIFGSEWVGLKNFQYLFTTTDAWIITRNTILYNLAFIVINTVFSVGLALLISELHNKLVAKTIQTFFMMPHFLSWAVVAIIGTAFLERDNGYVNYLTNLISGAPKRDWYQVIEVWPFLILLINTWKSIGFASVLYFATIVGISKDYYEAAVLDGASRLQQARYITIPHLRTIISIQIILALGGIFRGDFGLFYTVTKNSGPLYPVTSVIDTYVYNGLMSSTNLGMSAAAGFYQSMVGFIVILLANKVVTKIDPDSAMF